MEFNMEKFQEFYADILKEVGNIGAGNAATALSKMINKKIDMEVPHVEIIPTEEIVEILGGEELVVVGIYVGFFEDINGTILFILNKESADNLINMLFGMNKKYEEYEMYNEMEFSAMQEIGNILASSYINSISSLSNLNINISVPSVTVDMAGSILSVPAIEYSQISDQMILIENKLKEGNNEIVGKIFVLPDMESYEKLLRSLGVNIDG